ncbi:MAG: efflux RND transporter permease subunit [Bdellovibrionia bacterium]
MLDLLIKWSLKNRIFVVSFAALLVVIGFEVIRSLPVDVFPDLNRPTVTIMTEASGMAPEEVETLVTYPLETAMNGLPFVERVRSSSGVGLSVIYVEFSWGSDIYRNRQLVQEKVDIAKERLPQGITPVLGPISSVMGEIQFVGLYTEDAKLDPMELRTYADWTLRPRLLAINGVSQVISLGGGVRQFQILISADKLQKYQLSLEELQKNLTGISLNTTGGFYDLNGQEFLIRNLGSVRSKEEIESSVAGIHFGRPILVSDIASVEEQPMVKRGDASINGRSGVLLAIQKQPSASTIELTKRIDTALKDLEKTLPPNIKMKADLFKQADFIQLAIENVQMALRDGVVLVFIILFIFLANFRTTAITMTAIPLSFILTAIVFKFFDLSVNTMTLGGLAIAIGELVDDAIVDVENVFRRLKENSLLSQPKPILSVVFTASSEIRNSIVIATIIVCLVFVPLFALDGIEGRLFMPLGIAYIVSLVASLLVSLTVTPALCSYLLKDQRFLAQKESALVKKFKLWDTLLLQKTLSKPWQVILPSLILFLISVFWFFSQGRDFLPKFNEGTATILISANPGISLEESNNIGKRAEEILLKIPEVKYTSRRTGRAELDEHAEGVNISEIDLDFKEGGRDRETVLADIRTQLEQIPDVGVSVGQPISHRLDHLLSGVRSQIAIKIFGPNLTVLRQKAAEIERLLKPIEGLVDVNAEQQVLVPQLKIEVMRDLAAQYGISTGELTENLHKALHGQLVGQILEDQKTIDLVMRFDSKSREQLESIGMIPVKVMPDGKRVLLSEVADIYESHGPNTINRENSQRRVIVQANTQGRSLASVMAEIQSVIAAKVQLPEGYYLVYGGQFESQIKAMQKIWILALLSFLGVFLVLYANFKSWFIVFQIMLSIPLALIGGVIAMKLAGVTLSVASLVAFITLSGIASRNGIMMVSHYLHLMKYEGMAFDREMVIKGSLERLVPVLMTALTAILALLPLVLSAGEPGKEILHPVAVVIVGGLLSSTLLDIIVTPVVFYNFGRKSAEEYVHRKESESL